MPNGKPPKTTGEHLVSLYGYVTGFKTLYKNIKQLQSGELLYFTSKDKKLNVSRYFIYKPSPQREGKIKNWIEELDFVMNNIEMIS